MHNYHFYVLRYEKEDSTSTQWDILPQHDHFICANNYFVLIFTRSLGKHHYWFSYSKVYDNNITLYFERDRVMITVKVKNKRNFDLKNIPSNDVNKLLNHHNLWK